MHELIQRPLTIDTLDSVWSLDRRESIDGFYRWHDGALELTATEYEVAGWPPGEAAHSTPRLKQSLADGGWAMGWFSGKQLAAAVVVAPYPLCGVLNLRQLQFLHVGRDWRGRGVGTAMLTQARQQLLSLGGSGLYVSATPSRRTIDFYLAHGCCVLAQPDPELFDREPDDLHLRG